MILTKTQIELIDYSWEVLSANPNLMMRFYDHLFELAPEAIHFFPDDMAKQSEKLAYTIGFIVGNLDRLEEIKDAIEDVGRFHNKLQIDAYHYENLKKALLMTIEENMGEQYSINVGEAWETVIDFVSETMLNAPGYQKGRLKRLLSKVFT